MSSSTTYPLADAWLRDLELLLHGIDPGERAEVLAGVREHLDSSLPAGASVGEVRRVLAELGSPQSVADEAWAGHPASAAPAPASSTRVVAMARRWVPITVGILLGLALALSVFVTSAASSYSTSSSSSSAAVAVTPQSGGEVAPTVDESTQTQVNYDASPLTGVAVALLFTWLLWLPATVLVLFSPLWSTRQRVALSLLTPVAALLLSGLPWLGWAITGKEIGINVGAWLGLAVALGGGVWLLVRTCRVGFERAGRESLA